LPTVREPKIIFEHPEFLAIDKPAGLLVHPARHAGRDSRFTIHDSREKEKTLVDWLLAHYPEVSSVGDDPADRPGIVHRLDKETSGVMLVARTRETFLYLKTLFKKCEIKKTYLAWVAGAMKEPQGVINVPIGIKSGSIKRSVHSTKMQKEALTEYRLLREQKNSDGASYSLLEVSPQTGRTHQIRVHLASLGHPVLGDSLYGKNVRNTVSRLMLHARSLEFTFSDGIRICCEAEIPKEFVNIIETSELKAKEGS